MTMSGVFRHAVVTSLGLLCVSCGRKASDDATPPNPTTCGPYAVAQNDTCVPVGVPPAACSDGFESDGAAGCRPVLPPDPCPHALVAFPGEAKCRPLGVCSGDKWPIVPAGQNAIYADSSVAADGDGTSPAAAVRTIAAAIALAPDHGLVVLARGRYVERFLKTTKSVTVAGGCPSDTSIDLAAGALTSDGDLTLRDLSFVLDDALVAPKGALKLQRVYADGVALEVLARSVDIVDLASDDAPGGVRVEAEHGTIDRILVRNARRVALDGIDVPALGIHAAFTDPGIHIHHAVVEGSAQIGLSLGGTAMVESSVFRENGIGGLITQPLGFDDYCKRRPHIHVDRVYLARNRYFGVLVQTAELDIRNATILDTEDAPGTVGAGLVCGGQIGVSTVRMADSVVARSRSRGIRVLGCNARLEGVLVRDTYADNGGILGGGVELGGLGSETFVAKRVRVDHSVGTGVVVTGLSGTLEQCEIAGVSAGGQLATHGDGLDVVAASGPVVIDRCLVTGAERAGIGLFSAAAVLRDVVVRCNGLDAIALGTSPNPFSFGASDAGAPEFTDEGERSRCGCDAESACLGVAVTYAPANAPDAGTFDVAVSEVEAPCESMAPP